MGGKGWGDRPLGISALAILSVMVGVLILIAGVQVIRGASTPRLVGDGELGGLIANIFGVLALAVGVFNLVLAWGLWLGKGWGWTLGIIDEGLGALSCVYQIAIGMWLYAINLLVVLYVLWYLFQPQVREYFGGVIRTPSSQA